MQAFCTWSLHYGGQAEATTSHCNEAISLLGLCPNTLSLHSLRNALNLELGAAFPYSTPGSQHYCRQAEATVFHRSEAVGLLGLSPNTLSLHNLRNALTLELGAAFPCSTPGSQHYRGQAEATAFHRSEAVSLLGLSPNTLSLHNLRNAANLELGAAFPCSTPGSQHYCGQAEATAFHRSEAVSLLGLSSTLSFRDLRNTINLELAPI